MDRLAVTDVGGDSKAHIAAAAGSSPCDRLRYRRRLLVASYTTERLGQKVGNDLRVRLYHRLQQLSLGYYDPARVGTILSTLTTDVQTIQSFASVTDVNIATDTLTIAAMVFVMFCYVGNSP